MKADTNITYEVVGHEEIRPTVGEVNAGTFFLKDNGAGFPHALYMKLRDNAFVRLSDEQGIVFTGEERMEARCTPVTIHALVTIMGR